MKKDNNDITMTCSVYLDLLMQDLIYFSFGIQGMVASFFSSSITRSLKIISFCALSSFGDSNVNFDQRRNYTGRN